MEPIFLSFVIPVYNEQDNVRPLIAEIRTVMSGLGKSYEIIAIDDGSRDRTLATLKDIAATLPELKIISFSFSSGQAAAFDAGFRHARGRWVVTLDGDLQNDPQDLPRMLAKAEEGFDVVSGWRKPRRDPFFRTLSSRIANRLVRRVIPTSVHDLGCSFKIYRQDILRDLHLYGEMHRLLCPLLEMRGAKTGEIVVNHRPRVSGTSKYGLNRTFKIILDVIHLWFQENYQTKPMYVFGGFGLASISVGTLICLYTLYDKWQHGVFVHRNPLMLIGISVGMIGVLFVGMGLLAEILVRTYYESQGKTAYRIRETHGVDSHSQL